MATPMISAQNVHKSFGQLEVLKGIDLEVQPGEVACLLGPSGSGKTTSSRAIGGLSKEWKGKVVLDGHELARGARQRSAEDRKRIQYIFQNPYLSLNPRRTVGQILVRPLEIFGIARGRAARSGRRRAPPRCPCPG